MGHDCSGQQEWRAYVDVEDFGKVIWRCVCDGFAEENAGVVDEDVDFVAEGFEGGLDNFFWCVDGGEVGLHDRGSAAVVQGLDV